MWQKFKQIANYFKMSFVLDIKATMAYPTSFWFAFTAIPLWSLVQVLFIETIYGQTESFLGYSKYENYVLFGTFKLVQSIAVIFFFVRLEDLADKLRGVSDWSLDVMLLKPIDSQLFATTGRYWFGSISSVVTGIALIWYGLAREPHGIGISNVLMYTGTVTLAVILFYLLYLFIQTWLFWFEYLRIGENLWFSIQGFGEQPRALYRGGMGILWNIAIPITLSGSISADYLFGRMPYINLVWYAAVMVILFYLTRLFWQHSIKKYSSFSS